MILIGQRTPETLEVHEAPAPSILREMFFWVLSTACSRGIMSSLSDDSPPQAENFRDLLFEMLEKHCFSCINFVHLRRILVLSRD